ncbi:MAG: (d)CMP kinase [Chthoniobacterales bacterium]|nr:(d)CMP kinase [Chthoniobacterales bacterium]
MPHTIITIDGPAASGKTIAGRRLASRLGYLFVSSGHYYRALAWTAHHDQINISELKAVQHWLEDLLLQPQIIEEALHLFINGSDVTPHLNDAVVTGLVSPLAALPAVRNFLLTKLRSLADHHNLVMEGRDIGSVVFPEAPWKIYMDASPEERARRRTKEGIIDNIAQRDQQDKTRATAPLVIPEGAIVIDTTNLSVTDTNQAIDEILEKFMKKETSKCTNDR